MTRSLTHHICVDPEAAKVALFYPGKRRIKGGYEREDSLTGRVGMRNDPDFNIRLTKQVAEQPILYNHTLDEFSNKKEVEKAWQEIGKKMEESGPACRERWMTLRGNYSRALKLAYSENPPKRDYYLARHMKFLLPYMKSRKHPNSSPQGRCSSSSAISHLSTEATSETNHICSSTAAISGPSTEDTSGANQISIKASNSDDERFEDDKSMLICQKSDETNQNLVTINDSIGKNYNFAPKFDIYPVDFSVAKRPKMELQSVEYLGNNTMPKNVPQSYENSLVSGCGVHVTSRKCENKIVEENPDLNFFKSLLPEMAQLNCMQKTKFKIAVLSYMYDILNSENIENHITSSNCFGHMPQ